MMGHLVALASVASYAFACLTSVWLACRKEGKGQQGSVRIGWMIGTFGLMCHSLSVWYYLFNSAVGTSARYLLCLSWVLSAMFIWLWRKFFDPLFGALAFPIILGMFTASSIVAHVPDNSAHSSAMVSSSWLLTLGHVAPVLVAEACLVGLVVISLAQIIQERRLKQKSALIHFLSGPSIVKLQLINASVLKVGFGAISLGIISATVWTFLNGRVLGVPDLLQLSGYVTWICFAVMFAIRSKAILSQRQIALAYCLIAGFAFLGLLSAHSWLGIPLHSDSSERQKYQELASLTERIGGMPAFSVHRRFSPSPGLISGMGFAATKQQFFGEGSLINTTQRQTGLLDFRSFFAVCFVREHGGKITGAFWV